MDTTMKSLRILSKGQITNLDNGFDLGGEPFSVFVKPKEYTMETCVILSCKLLCDTTTGDFPVPLRDWTSGLITKIAPEALSLDDYDIYWGAGETINI